MKKVNSKYVGATTSIEDISMITYSPWDITIAEPVVALQAQYSIWFI